MECERPKPMLEEKITFFFVFKTVEAGRGRTFFCVDIGMRIERERTGKMLKEQDVHGAL